MTSLPNGIHRISPDRYHADPHERPSMSSTLGRTLLNQSPRHAWTDHPRLNPDWEPSEGSKVFDFGRAAHTKILGVGDEYHAYPEEMLASNGAASTKAAKQFAEDVRAAGGVPLKQDDVDKIEAMALEMERALKANKITLDPAHSEVVALAEIDGCPVRAMLDNAPFDGPIYDFKTTESASSDAFMRSVMNYGYDFQAGHYVETWKAATGEERRFRFIAQEKKAPFEVCVVELSGEVIEMAKRKTRRAREIWRNCLAADHWPGYPPGVNVIDLPAFYHERWLERESREDEFKRTTGHDILDAGRRWQAPEGFAAE